MKIRNRLAFLVALAGCLFGALQLPGQSPYTIPTSRTPTGGWVTGSDIWNGGNLPSYSAVACTTAVCDGTTDDTAHIQSCINALSSGQAAVLPTNVSCKVNGIVRLKSNTVLRGTGTANTPPYLPSGHSGKTRIVLGSGGRLDTQNFSFSGSIYPTTSYQTLPNTCKLSGSPAKGATSLTNASTDTSCAVSVGMYISVYGNDDPTLISAVGEDGWCGYCAFNDGFYTAQQIVQVTGITSGTGGNGSVFTISPGLFLAPDVNPETVIGNGGSGTQTEPAGAKYTIVNFTTTKAGYEDLVVDASTADIGSNPIIRMQGCLECWVKDVETYDTGSSSESAHVKLEVNYGTEVRDSVLHDQRSGASGSGYGVYQEWTNTSNKIENNAIYHSRHGLLMQGGGSGNAFLYNYVDDGYTDDLTYFASMRSSHGAHPFMNLFEGNIISHFTADDFIGSSSHTTLFRNWLRGGEPNFNLGSGTIPSFPPNNGFNAVDLYAGQSYYSYVNDVLGNGGLGSGISGTWSSATLTGYNRYPSPSTPLVYSADPSALTFGTANIPGSSTTLLRQGSYDYKTLGVAFNDGGNCGSSCTYANSLYYTSKPSWMGSCSFPAQGSDLTPVATTNLLAYTRTLGTSCTGGTNFTLGITAANGSVSGTNCSAGTYASGTSIGACTATPNLGYSFASWSGTGSGSTCSGAGTCGPFSLTANSTLTASFTLNSWTLTAIASGSGSGTIICTPASGSHVNYGASVSCNINPSGGSVVTSVTGGGGTWSGNPYLFNMPNNAVTVTATFSNVLSTPTFSPAAGTYGTAQLVAIAPATATKIVSMTEGSNGNASNGDAPSRNAYTNCATGYNGSALTPVGQPVGNLYCTATAKSNALAAGGPNLGVVTSAISGTGTHSLDNGNGAGGTDSATSITATYAQANQNGCPVGTNIPTSLPGVTLLGSVASANTTYGITTASSGFNTSSLEPTKWVVSNGDSADHYVRETCQKVNTTSVAGEHLEFDTNYNDSTGQYYGFGMDFDFPNSKFRYCPQGCSGWKNIKLVAADGTTLTTYSWPANHWIYTQRWEHRSGSSFYYDTMCIEDFTAGTALTCYAMQDATSGLTPSGTAVNKSSWTRNEFALQHQFDVNGASATLVNTVDFDNLIAFSMEPNVCVTSDGSTPTASSGACTHGSTYFTPVAVPSSLTLKALAAQSGFTNSAVGSSAYVITPLSALVVTATNGTVSGSNCLTGNYATGIAVGACTATPNAGYSFTGWSGTGACSAASGTGTVSCTLSSNGTLTATFAPILTCGDPSQLSPNFSGTYQVPPTVLPITVGFVSPTSGCAMYYTATTDGTTPSAPTCSSTAYPGGDFSISGVGTYQYRVIACQGGYVSSAVVGGAWHVTSVTVTLTGTVSGNSTIQ